MAENTGTEPNPERRLHERARDAMSSGKVPKRRPDRMWGGPGDGTECSICRRPVKRDELGLELEFMAGAADVVQHHVHIHCFKAWESERDNLELAPDRLQRSA